MTEKNSKIKYILTELYHHLPFSTFGVMLALLAMGVLTFIVDIAYAQAAFPRAAADLYHVFHPAHVMLSALASTAMFMKHDGNTAKAMCVGFFGAIILCTLSDAVFPFLGGVLLGAQMHFHIDLLEHPGLILPFAIV